MENKFKKAFSEIKSGNKNFQCYSINKDHSSFVSGGDICKATIMMIIVAGKDYTVCKATINNQVIDCSKDIDSDCITVIVNNSKIKNVRLHVNISNSFFYRFEDESKEKSDNFVFIYNENEAIAESIMFNGKNHISPKMSQLVFKKELTKQQIRTLCFNFLQMTYPDFFAKISEVIENYSNE